MGRSINGLIRASGYSGVSGQSFRNHVNDAETGARVTDYVLLGMVNWASGDYTPGVNVENGGQLHFTFDFDAASRFLQIRLPESAMFGVNTAPSDPVAECILDDVAFDSGLTGNAITARFLGQYAYSSSMTLTPGHYSDFSGFYPSMEEPPDFNDYQYEVGLFPTPPDVTGYTAENFDIVYPNDAGEFNPTFTYSIQVDVRKRAHSNTWEIQWSFDGSFTDLTAYDNNAVIYFMANKLNSPITVYYRYRVASTGPSWLVSASTTCHFHN